MQTDHETLTTTDPASLPDEGYNQWVEFCMDYKNFPYEHGVALKSMDDIDLECGKLYVGSRDIELEETMLPRPLYPADSSGAHLGACGRYCAAMGTQGTIVLSEQTKLGFPATVGGPALRIQWKCLYKSYSYNDIQVTSLDSHYEVTSVTTPPKDRALGRITIKVTYHP